MRNLFIIGMLVIGAFMAGWFTIDRSGDNTTIQFNRAEIRSDAQRAIDKGREVLDRRQQEQEQQRIAEQNPGQFGQGFFGQGQNPAPNAGQRPNGFGQPAGFVNPNSSQNQPAGNGFPQGQFQQGQFPQGQFPQGQFPQGQFPQGQNQPNNFQQPGSF